jgi:SPP1 gp7 family putative phage head morphogenesis protein
VAIRRDTLRLIRQLRNSIGVAADQAVRNLTRAWVAAVDDLDQAMADAITDIVTLAFHLGRWPYAWELARIHRLQVALETSDQALTALAAATVTEVTTVATGAVDTTVDIEPRILATQLPPGEIAAATKTFAQRLQPSALELIVGRTTQQITSTTRPLSRDAGDAVRRELVRGVALGRNPRVTAREMLKRVEGGFNGGLTRAMVIARTETLDAYRATAAYTHQANQDVIAGWVWISALSGRTCPACWGMHGTVHPAYEPGPLDHQQGRCTRAPKTKSWAELGLQVKEPPDLIPDAQVRFWALPEEQQAAIMGPGRLEALKSGRMTWDQLAVRRSTAAWRDSYIPRPIRDIAA